MQKAVRAGYGTGEEREKITLVEELPVKAGTLSDEVRTQLEAHLQWEIGKAASAWVQDNVPFTDD